MTNRESEHCIVPSTPGNAGRGKAVSPTRNPNDPPTIRSDGRAADEKSASPKPSVLDRLDYIHERAITQPNADFSNVSHLLKYQLLWLAFRKLKLNKAPGVDGVSVDDYEANLRSNLQDLESRLQRGAYRPQPSLRRNIPKGNGKTRPLGIACVEDKIVQRAVVMILEQIYEVDFSDNSYGFRPGRSCHDALKSLGKTIGTKKVNFISDSDIRAFFDEVDHDKLMDLMRVRIGDTRLLRLIFRFLKAGVMIDGDWQTLNRKLQGHLQYYGVSDNWDFLLSYRDRVIELVSRWVGRRSQRSMSKTNFFKQYLPRHPLARPRCLTNLFV